MSQTFSDKGPVEQSRDATRYVSSQGDGQWQHHEHVSEQAQLQAQRLLDDAGTPELAKQAIDLAADHQHAAPFSMDDFARSAGFISYLALFEASMPVASEDGHRWCVTALEKGGWISWNDHDLEMSSVFKSKDEAIASVPRRDSIT